ncbi:MAG: platelet-activating factor acetylhydrolase IB subunit [Colwellia sp.]|nr:platelet-activating factor acetylhydrolase IB subunit [Colwellia sp.]MCW8863502.1 platelet-activating factor acetylhydrolase IB subunit [Colwellia sp.]MCW9079936.1 platelet-activating factor acetylhydrolase IB subunit [Colwellia sp.]
MKKVTKHVLTILLFSGLAACSTLPENYSYDKDIEATQAKMRDGKARKWSLKRHESKLQEKQGKQIDLVFVGDSITHGWEGKKGRAVWKENFADLNAFNLGYSGDRTEHVLWRLQNGEVDGLAPKLVVLMIGTNNTGHRKESSEDTAYGIFAITQELRQRLPTSKILLLGIFPRGATADDPLRKLNEGVNDIIKNYAADTEHIHYLNINEGFLKADGSLPKSVMPDRLHPNQKGYQIWATAMLPTIKRLMVE